MNENGRLSFLKYGDWIYRGLVLLGVGSIAYLSMKFVTRAEWVLDVRNVQQTLTSVHEKVSVVETAIKLQQARDVVVQDHEIRIRDLERKVK